MAAHPIEVIKEAVAESSVVLVIIHNHKCDELQLSQDNIEMTNRIISACELVGIKVLGYIIIGDNDYFNFFNEGLIEER
ncbi:MAG: JAB domain-containing protein [Caldisericia bacterium]|nr:JAB domain-containing protein [Caldisericia bacterium]